MRKVLNKKQSEVAQILKRARDIYSFGNNKDLCIYFGLSESLASQHIGRGTIPWRLIQSVVDDSNVSYDYLLKGVTGTSEILIEECELAIDKALVKAGLYKLIDDDKMAAMKKLLSNSINEMHATSIAKKKQKISNSSKIA
ncbi:hypothetical protein [Pseudoalteromonas luteoviolacea]|uniref:Bacteriophage CI repressor n=1 Tax=Pseudoalteromonas luteoviolacea S4060-1 TaxID=1365257 RepID=A0A162BKB2_9GAMM|nr:hypothetical protein [Pseudoalteromonas luteoviolacea]KZN63356.1 hypothetical protein N478_03645 [Pseudoalteromonas luteoviolacea S4060-1]